MSPWYCSLVLFSCSFLHWWTRCAAWRHTPHFSWFLSRVLFRILNFLLWCIYFVLARVIGVYMFCISSVLHLWKANVYVAILKRTFSFCIRLCLILYSELCQHVVSCIIRVYGICNWWSTCKISDAVYHEKRNTDGKYALWKHSWYYDTAAAQ